MGRGRAGALVVLGLAVPLAAIAAVSCGQDVTDAAADAGGDAPSPDVTSRVVPPPPSDAGSHDAGDADADAGVTLVIAKGDPCRGLAVPADRHFVASGMCARAVATSIDHVR